MSFSDLPAAYLCEQVVRAIAARRVAAGSCTRADLAARFAPDILDRWYDTADRIVDSRLRSPSQALELLEVVNG
ncbi:hypothetical protein [Tistrella mobilis]|uniref:Uncharacterized protein n=1 Tax=Tistrella mobilis (strain KA081020-065) TaxID=1110502 RepID=I3TGL7_TISMK|nr:hypothetical protein [Tistrella mobilis]AFK51905.1 hypothetical protein TMO_0066 [Tistrella mobilis KA081020-065]